MNKITALAAVTIMFMLSCNNNSSDPVEKADSTNKEKNQIGSDVSNTKENTSEFLVKIADDGMAEVASGSIGQQKANNKAVKDFASRMVKDHTAVNEEVKSLAARLNITLPEGMSEDNQKMAADLKEKKTKNFDKDYIDMMISDHKKDIDFFKNASSKNMDAEVKTFINATIPKLEAHLASADSIHKMLKQQE